ncbi:MAG: SsrA-binding protein SmpB [Candidatus Goldbacteria bacterium]|nr:SsrA-binding protein SmpB [Candidatus Goldiibacteriota bacterium]HPD18156.1 SsrA-binding protein SmpB [Candidatus Goldiibacteriota bacterium]
MSQITIHNRKAFHDYFILEKFEAGIALKGTEVKSIREGRANIQDSFARIMKEEVFLFNMHISPYSHGNIYNPDPLRDRKLLLHKKEIHRLMGLLTQKGLALIPLSVYFKNGRVKVELALAKGKKQYDRREEIKKRDLQREQKRYKINM